MRTVCRRRPLWREEQQQQLAQDQQPSTLRKALYLIRLAVWPTATYCFTSCRSFMISCHVLHGIGASLLRKSPNQLDPIGYENAHPTTSSCDYLALQLRSRMGRSEQVRNEDPLLRRSERLIRSISLRNLSPLKVRMSSVAKSSSTPSRSCTRQIIPDPVVDNAGLRELLRAQRGRFMWMRKDTLCAMLEPTSSWPRLYCSHCSTAHSCPGLSLIASNNLLLLLQHD